MCNHWHTHSMYSVLDGLSKVQEIVDKAKEMGAKVAVITDHASISSLPELFKKTEGTGIKPVIGCEFYVVDEILAEGMKGKKRYHFTVWAKNWDGVESIMAQLTLANTQFFMRPIITVEQIMNFHDCMVGTACCFGMLSHPDYKEIIPKLKDAYGEDCYLEIMPHKVVLDGETDDRQKIVNERAIEMSAIHDLQLLATNDSHYTREEDGETQKVLLAVQYGKFMSEWKGWGNESPFFMRTITEMITAFKELEYVPNWAISASMRSSVYMANKVDIVMPKFKINLPSVHASDTDFARDSILKGWNEKIKGKVGAKAQEYHERLIYELGVIKKMGFMKYFLMVEDIIRWSRGRGIMVGPGRGSAAGSLVCYLMDITQLDPIKHGLFFERFLNPERVNLPDIDVDFQDNRRQEVFEYIGSKYGKECVGQINTFGMMSIKSAFRDVARTFGISPMTVNLLSKQIDEENGIESFSKVPELVEFARRYPTVIDFTKKLEGTIRQVGVHPCGIIISNQPLETSCVMERRKEGVIVTNWDMRSSENFGLLKMDVLGLTTLSILDHAKRLIFDNYGVNIDFNSIPLEDPETMKMFSVGECVGVFQFEGVQMQELLKSLNASDFPTITATTALYRPGPLQAGLTQRYVKVARGEEALQYECPELEPILSSTNGVMVYQEQVMRIFSDLAGFTYAQADQMRKIIGKKLGKEEFDKHRVNFVKGCTGNGIDGTVADGLFSDMAEFASYSFNLAHAAAYTVISVWCMYLKAHYSSEFMAAYMSCVKSEAHVGDMVSEAKRLGIAVNKPHINISTNMYVLDDGQIMAPLGAIKGVGEKAVECILEARKAGVFLSVDDMVERVKRRTVHSGIIGILGRAGALETLGVIEHDKEQRNKNFAELLPMFNELPSMDIKDCRMDELAIPAIELQVTDLAAQDKKLPLQAKYGKRPVIMAINLPVKGEKTLLVNRGSKMFTEKLLDYGINMGAIYYTSVIKAVIENPAKAGKKLISDGLEIIKQEIVAVSPKLIVCFASSAIPLFIPDGKMSKLDGKVVYSKLYDCYVLFSWSPQYASYKEQEVGALFDANMQKIYEIFGGNGE